jgi:hypothetical protein
MFSQEFQLGLVNFRSTIAGSTFFG